MSSLLNVLLLWPKLKRKPALHDLSKKKYPPSNCLRFKNKAITLELFKKIYRSRFLHLGISVNFLKTNKNRNFTKKMPRSHRKF